MPNSLLTATVDITNMTVKDAILKAVEVYPGVDERRLAIDVMGMVNPSKFDEDIYNAMLTKLTKDKDIIILEYILPEVLCTLKSLYFPKGTAFVLEKLR